MKSPELNLQNYDLSVTVRNLGLTSIRGEVLLDDINLTINQGEHVAIHGASGAGKSLLAEALCLFPRGKELQQTGSVDYTLTNKETGFAINPTAIKGYDILQRLVGYGPQGANLDPDRTAEENILAPARLENIPTDEVVLQEVYGTLGLDGIHAQQANELSGGQKLRAALARPLARAPRFVILDEPTAALDPELKQQTSAMLASFVNETGTTVISITHEPEEVATATRRIEMERGQIIFDSAS